ncbi:MAG TPA: hypothetical protein VGM43_04940 [Bryobacteraceae bacterium]
MDLGNLGAILGQYVNASPEAPPPGVEEHYQQVAGNSSPPQLAAGLADAFRSQATPPFSEMMRTLFSNSNGEQRAGILNQLLPAVGPALLASGGLSIAGLLHGGKPAVTAEEANLVPPEEVQHLAEHAQKQNPSIVDQASEFYSHHPTLVKCWAPDRWP